MAYRSLKPLIGETKIERKCRILFLSCLTLFIVLGFYAVNRIAENLVMQATRKNGENLIKMMLVHVHHNQLLARVKKDPASALMRDLEYDIDFTYDLLSLESQTASDLNPRVLSDPEDTPITEDVAEPKADVVENDQWTPPHIRETGKLPYSDIMELRDIVMELHRKVDEEEAKKREEAAQRDKQPSDDGVKSSPPIPEPVFKERILRGKNRYEYFAPLKWSNSCTLCHDNSIAAIEATGAADVRGMAPPFMVAKVTMGYKQTANAINRARAILIAVAIVILVAAMIALYIITHYIIVNPLKHLRDVSDEVSQGKMDVRANITTNDEFEELGASFNTMLRHLTDTQTALRTTNEELDTKLDQLAQLNMRLYEMNRLKSDFLANMSHELRTPLNSIIGFSEVLQGIDSLSEKQKRYAQNIQKSGRVLLDMINDILDLAKMEAGKMDVKPSEFQLDVIVNAQCDMVRSLTEEKNIDLHVNVAEDLPAVYQDQAKFQQILTNLLSNAIKFTPEGGRITVSASCNDSSHLELVVADTGVGIAEEDREIIFEKFRQGHVPGVDNLTREYSGTGLGLSILKELCKLMHGEITFESQVGIGSTFRVTIPWLHDMNDEAESEIANKLDDLDRQQRAEQVS